MVFDAYGRGAETQAPLDPTACVCLLTLAALSEAGIPLPPCSRAKRHAADLTPRTRGAGMAALTHQPCDLGSLAQLSGGLPALSS